MTPQTPNPVFSHISRIFFCKSAFLSAQSKGILVSETSRARQCHIVGLLAKVLALRQSKRSAYKKSGKIQKKYGFGVWGGVWAISFVNFY